MEIGGGLLSPEFHGTALGLPHLFVGIDSLPCVGILERLACQLFFLVGSRDEADNPPGACPCFRTM